MTDVVLPDNFTLNFDKAITVVNWKIQNFKFGKNCTIDLFRGEPSPAGINGSNAQGQPSYGEEGFAGGRGGDGPPGKNGITLNLSIFDYPKTGSLWIRTDGAPGGKGGNGGSGGLGGGWHCGGRENISKDGGRGGRGGAGGNGGRGGDTARVVIHVKAAPGTLIRNENCGSPSLNPPKLWHPDHKSMVIGWRRSVRPPNTYGNEGTIVIWGVRGPGWIGGDGGRGGMGGDGPSTHQHYCGFLLRDVYGGDDGPDGNPGNVGQAGNCSKVEIRQE